MFIELKNVSKKYRTKEGDLEVLGGIDLAVERGEFLCLVGRNGCGKSTLLRIVAGLERDFEGEVLVDGAPVARPTPQCGMIFQQYALFPWRTVLGNVAFGLEARGVPRKEREERAAAFIKLVGLSGFEKHYPNQLSGGMQQKAAIARALVNEPQALLMDEPFSALDTQSREVLQDEILRIRRERGDLTILFVTHSIEEALYLGDRAAVLTARPARIREEIRLDRPRPRNRADPELVRLRERIGALLKEEGTGPSGF